jgi:hypothetical protein
MEHPRGALCLLDVMLDARWYLGEDLLNFIVIVKDQLLTGHPLPSVELLLALIFNVLKERGLL